MHKFLRAAGFSMYTKKKDIESLASIYKELLSDEEHDVGDAYIY